MASAKLVQGKSKTWNRNQLAGTICYAYNSKAKLLFQFRSLGFDHQPKQKRKAKLDIYVGREIQEYRDVLGIKQSLVRRREAELSAIKSFMQDLQSECLSLTVWAITSKGKTCMAIGPEGGGAHSTMTRRQTTDGTANLSHVSQLPCTFLAVSRLPCLSRKLAPRHGIWTASGCKERYLHEDFKFSTDASNIWLSLLGSTRLDHLESRHVLNCREPQFLLIILIMFNFFITKLNIRK